MTMTFVVMGLGTVFNALTNRRDPTSGLTAPILQALAISLVPVAMIVLATQLPGLQAGLLSTSLTGLQWLECLGLALLLPIVIEVSKGVRRRRASAVVVVDARRAVHPSRALAGNPP
jgi:Ca2+-transporting ATPase